MHCMQLSESVWVQISNQSMRDLSDVGCRGSMDHIQIQICYESSCKTFSVSIVADIIL